MTSPSQLAAPLVDQVPANRYNELRKSQGPTDDVPEHNKCGCREGREDLRPVSGGPVHELAAVEVPLVRGDRGVLVTFFLREAVGQTRESITAFGAAEVPRLVVAYGPELLKVSCVLRDEVLQSEWALREQRTTPGGQPLEVLVRHVHVATQDVGQVIKLEEEEQRHGVQDYIDRCWLTPKEQWDIQHNEAAAPGVCKHTSQKPAPVRGQPAGLVGMV
mmetsp:Transcript_14073/g.40180  ORF Transcript_14073/g.40180 Transcript_14073/m.40180 type:complete len:218 (-) Transcript_14073:817-1470(-)